MLANYKILTVTHKSTNLKAIGDFVIKADDDQALRRRLEAIKVRFQLDELLYLPTCNRVMYFFTTRQAVDKHFATNFFQCVNPGLSDDINSIGGIACIYEGEEALEHLLDVAASIDSLVIGERQILRQLREAYDQCREWGLTGDFLRIAIQQAVAAAKAVYANTRIGDKPVSVASLAIQKMLQAQLPKNSRILLIGAGQTNQLVAKFLNKHGFDGVTVFNRSLDKAEQLANLLNGRARPLENLTAYREGFDCLIVCTGATDCLITPELYKNLLQAEAGRKVVIDLSIPHNVAEEVAVENNVHYIEIEGLRNLAATNLAFREKEVERAKKLLLSYRHEFHVLLKQRQVELAMRRVPTEIKAVKEKAINEVFRREVDLLDEQSRELVEKMMAYMEKKCIGIPMKVAREAAFVQ